MYARRVGGLAPMRCGVSRLEWRERMNRKYDDCLATPFPHEVVPDPPDATPESVAPRARARWVRSCAVPTPAQRLFALGKCPHKDVLDTLLYYTYIQRREVAKRLFPTPDLQCGMGGGRVEG
eukprot:7385129-Prymnesium_polylepis.1